MNVKDFEYESAEFATDEETIDGIVGNKSVTPSGLTSKIDTDGSLIANSDKRLVSQKAIKTYIDALIPLLNALIYKGVIDCAGNPNYPAADCGHTYKISVAGKIGGIAGLNVMLGDLVICVVDGSISGDQITVGANWNILQSNIDFATDEETVSGISNTTSVTPKNLVAKMAEPGVIGETTPSSVYCTSKEIFKTSNADSPLTSIQCSGTIVNNYGMTDNDCLIELPIAAEGLAFLCILSTERSRSFRLKGKTLSGDKIYLLGVAGSAEGYVGVASGYVTGTSASFFTFKSSDGGYDWYCVPIFGEWVAG